MTRNDIFNIMRPIIMLATGIPECIMADERSAPSPAGSYASVEPMQNIMTRGQANVERSRVSSTRQPGRTDIRTDVMPQLITECSINFYRGEARDYAQKLVAANKRPDISQMLYLGKLGWQRVTGPNNLTSLQNNQQEQRAQISIYLLYQDKITVDINNIEIVPYEIHDDEARTDHTYYDGAVDYDGEVRFDDAGNPLVTVVTANLP